MASSSLAATALTNTIDKLLAAKAAGSELGHLVQQGSALLIEMRQREAEILGKAAEQTQPLGAAKERVEEAEAQMVELRYQRSQHVRGIAGCRNAVGDASLQSLIEAERMRTMRPQWAAARNEHESMLQRLALEYEERRRLCELRDATKEEARKLRAALVKQRALESSVSREIDGIVSAALATQAQLPQHPPPEPAVSGAPQLPLPLHSLRTSAQAFLKAYGGSLLLSTAKQPPPSCDPASPLRPHPLAVVLQAPRGKRGCASLTFNYYPSLELIAVAASPPTLADALRSLCAGDDGSDFPNESCLLRALGTAEAEGNLEGHLETSALLPAMPFKWAQRMGGIGPPLREHNQQSLPFRDVLELLSQQMLAASA